jgi:hypothetical protein
MGLYLAIFDGEDEVDGVEVGSYADFGTFRDAVIMHVENGEVGSQCPTLILHSDCDGEWSPSEAVSLQAELEVIAESFMRLPAEPLAEGWKPEIAKSFGLRPANLYDCFFDVDAEPLIERLIGLAQLSQDRNLPILFQ